MSIIRNKKKTESAFHRRGVAALEAALMLPLLVILTLGSIDIAQYVNLSQLVNNASREGARLVSRNGNESTRDVEDAVRSYMEDSFPQLSAAEISEATTITIRDEHSDPIANGDLTTIESGSRLSFEVVFNFSAIRWLNGPSWNGNTSQCQTICRRE
jgi:Flp pilus assembly protein TadG